MLVLRHQCRSGQSRHLQCDEFEQLVASEQTAAELACVADLNALDDEFEQLVGPGLVSSDCAA